MILRDHPFTLLDKAVAAVAADAEMGVDPAGFAAGRYNRVPGELSFGEALTASGPLPECGQQRRVGI